MTLDARLSSNLTSREDSQLREVGAKAAVEPGERGAKEEVAAADTSVV